jgi:hypothetical protein
MDAFWGLMGGDEAVGAVVGCGWDMVFGLSV